MDELLALERLQAECVAHDGVAPFNDQAVIEARRGERTIVMDGAGIALVGPGPRPEVELAVAPAERGQGVGRAIVDRLIAAHPGLEAWAHGDLPAARALATSSGFTPVRTLLQLRAAVPDAAATSTRATRAFRESDAEAWVAVNAAAFAAHPEQGALTLRDLADRRATAWHDDANLLLLDGTDGLDGYVWVKVEDGVGEVYALGVAPHAQGAGLGSRLLDAALDRMHELGVATATLYVEGDNEPALRLYRSRGFETAAIDVRWRHIDR